MARRGHDGSLGVHGAATATCIQCRRHGCGFCVNKELTADAAKDAYRRREDASRQWRWPGEDGENEGLDGGALSNGQAMIWLAGTKSMPRLEVYKTFSHAH
jgi:hypothetical protein